jgi:hypothetical protein
MKQRRKLMRALYVVMCVAILSGCAAKRDATDGPRSGDGAAAGTDGLKLDDSVDRICGAVEIIAKCGLTTQQALTLNVCTMGADAEANAISDPAVKNCVRHQYWAICLAAYLGDDMARCITSQHEGSLTGQSIENCPDTVIDIQNNARGLALWRDLLSAKCADCVANGPTPKCFFQPYAPTTCPASCRDCRSAVGGNILINCQKDPGVAPKITEPVSTEPVPVAP